MNNFFVDGAGREYYEFLEKEKLEKEENMGYRKLSKNELNDYGIKVNNGATQLLTLYKKYFDNSVEPIKALILINNDYNDEYYTHEVRGVVFYDALDNELVPLKEFSREFHSLESFNLDSILGFGEEAEEAIDDQIVFLNVPDLYVKE